VLLLRDPGLGAMKPTPEQARDLIVYFGSQRAAARAAGVAQSAIWGWLYPELARERSLASYHRRALDADYLARRRERARRSYYAARAAGRCVHCGSSDLLSEACCWDCLNKKEEAYALAL
jgi:hypothetical protein